MGKRQRVLGMVISLVVVGLVLMTTSGCDSAGAGGSGGGGSGGGSPESPWGAIASVNPAQAARVPASLENAQTAGGVSPTSVGISALVDTSGETAVFGRIMQDFMWNWLLDLVYDPIGSGTSRLFMAFLKDITEDPAVPFALDTPIDLGERDLPLGTSGPEGETRLDMGTMIVREVSATETVIHWSIPYSHPVDVPDGGVYYIRLNLIQTDADTLRFETRLGLQPNDGSGNPLPVILMSEYEAVDTDGGLYFYQWTDTESQTFQQYTDSNGMIRTFFNTMVREGSGENYDILYLMIGDDTGATIDSYQYDYTHPTQRSFEAYNQAGSLISQVLYGQTNPYRYPLKYVTRSGYTLNHDGSGNYWLDSAGNDSYDAGTDIDLTADGEVIDYVWDPDTYVSVGEWDVGDYSTWVSGKDFAGQSIQYLGSNSEITGLDSQAQVDDLRGHLDDWLLEIDSTIDIGTNDILTFPTNEADFYAALGLPLDPANFPTP